MNVVKITIEVHVNGGFIGSAPGSMAELHRRARAAACVFLDVPQLPEEHAIVEAHCLQAHPTDSPQHGES